jgi:hypothetical protein
VRGDVQIGLGSSNGFLLNFFVPRDLCYLVGKGIPNSTLGEGCRAPAKKNTSNIEPLDPILKFKVAPLTWRGTGKHCEVWYFEDLLVSKLQLEMESLEKGEGNSV